MNPAKGKGETCNLLRRVLFYWAVGVASLAGAELAGEEAESAKWIPNRVDYAMYYLSEVKDSPDCSMTARDGHLAFGEGITNPSMTCPDMFAWKLFVDVIRDEFWSRWAGEKDNWPEKPFRMCRAGEVPTKECCKPGASTNSATNCPRFPGDAERNSMGAHSLDQPRELMQSLTEHLFTQDFHGDLEQLEAAVEDEVGERRESSDPPPPRPCADYPLPEPDQIESIGRVLRFTNGSLTVRNRPFHNYLFENDLYNVEGVAAVFARNHRNVSERAPYRLVPVSSVRPGVEGISKIELPTNAIMIKSNWMNAELLKRIGEKYGWDFESGGHSYIKKKMEQDLWAQLW